MYRLLLLLLPLYFACSASRSGPAAGAGLNGGSGYGSIDEFDERLAEIIDPRAGMEQLASGFDWSEGPVWVDRDGGYLLFSDIPRNKVYKWSAATGDTSTYLQPSGFTGAYSSAKEPGSNGLLLDPQGRLVLCQHGDRRVARMDAPLGAPQPTYSTVVASYDGKRLNSPNDAVLHRDGSLYFTDPPYGLPGQANSTSKELDFQGVYRYDFARQRLTLLTRELPRPNGIAFTPDYRTLIVANSQPQRAVWMAYTLLNDGAIGAGEVFYDATGRSAPHGGVPDGMAMHRRGYLFATGPGGVYVFHPDRTLLGIIRTGKQTGNVTFDTDQRWLYIVADDLLLRLPIK